MRPTKISLGHLLATKRDHQCMPCGGRISRGTSASAHPLLAVPSCWARPLHPHDDTTIHRRLSLPPFHRGACCHSEPWNTDATAETRAGRGRSVESESLRTSKTAEHGPMGSYSKTRFAWFAISYTHPSPTLLGHGARRSSRGWGRWRISWQRTRIIGISSRARRRTPRMASPEPPSSSRRASAGSPRGPLPASNSSSNVRAVGEGQSRFFIIIRELGWHGGLWGRLGWVWGFLVGL